RPARSSSVWLRLFAAVAALSLSLPAQQELPELALPDAGGREHSLAAYRGKIVILNFWATWCVPCKDEMPVLAEAQRRFGEQGVVVLAASLDDNSTQQFIPRFARSY